MREWLWGLVSFLAKRIGEAWRRRDWYALVWWSECAAVLLGGIALYLLERYHLVAFSIRHQPYLHPAAAFCVALMVGTLLFWFASSPAHVARDKRKRQQARPGARAVDLARWARFPYVAAAVAGVVFTWPHGQRIERRSDRVYIEVCRFWDPKNDNGVSDDGRAAQHTIILALESRISGDDTLNGRVVVTKSDELLDATEADVASKRARELARRTHTDLVVWGSLVGVGEQAYAMQVTPARETVPLRIVGTSELVPTPTGPDWARLTEKPLVLASFILGYAYYNRLEFESAMPLLERALRDTPEAPAAYRTDVALISYYLGVCHGVTSHLRSSAESELYTAVALFEVAKDIWDPVQFPSERAMTLVNLGSDHRQLALLEPDPHKSKQLTQAEECYGEAVGLSKDGAWLALSGWGQVLADRAKLAEGAQSDLLREQAAQQFQDALRATPPKYTYLVLDSWASLLADQARSTRGEKAQALFRQAAAKYQQATESRSDVAMVFYNWGCALADWGRTTHGRAAYELLREACQKYEAALTTDPAMTWTLNNWGNALTSQAKWAEAPEADDLLSKACRKYQQALSLGCESQLVLSNWGYTLYAQAKLAKGKQAGILLEEAIQKYKAALDRDPHDVQSLEGWGGCLLRQAGMRGRDRSLVVAARAKFSEAEHLKPGSQAYNLACCAALLGDETGCHRYLREACDQPEAPLREDMLSDPDLAPVRGRPWFVRLVREAPSDGP